MLDATFVSLLYLSISGVTAGVNTKGFITFNVYFRCTVYKIINIMSRTFEFVIEKINWKGEVNISFQQVQPKFSLVI